MLKECASKHSGIAALCWQVAPCHAIACIDDLTLPLDKAAGHITCRWPRKMPRLLLLTALCNTLLPSLLIRRHGVKPAGKPRRANHAAVSVGRHPPPAAASPWEAA